MMCLFKKISGEVIHSVTLDVISWDMVRSGTIRSDAFNLSFNFFKSDSSFGTFEDKVFW